MNNYKSIFKIMIHIDLRLVQIYFYFNTCKKPAKFIPLYTVLLDLIPKIMILMTSKRKIYIYSIIVIISVFILSIIIYKSYKPTRINNYIGGDQIHFANAPISPSNILKDKNDIHLIHAQKNGLKNYFSTDSVFKSQIDELVLKSVLVKVTENGFYQMKSLTHSQPYLIPEAVDMLNDIGARFQKRLEEKKYNKYRFRITSLLRTEETQNKLCSRNSNATSHSAHLYGTTVDISYKNFYNIAGDSIESSYEAVQTLTNVLVEMRQECKFLAVRERKQSCFHLTVVLCRPIE